MRELDRWQQELERLMDASYKTVDSELFKVYQSGLKQIKAQLAGYVAQYDTLSFSKRLEVERLFGVAAEMDGILQGVFDSTKNAIVEHGKDAADIGYNGVWYALEGAENIQMSLPQLDQAFVEAAINQPVAGKTLSQRLYQDRKQLAKETQSAIVNGLLQGQGYSSIAGQINNLTEASYKQALRIARTEAGRIRSQAALKSYDAAREEGVDLRLAWMSTLDSKTRKDHQTLDGQIADEEGMFWTGGMTGAGYSGKAPRMFGVAKEDINCRCTTVAVVDGVAPELRLNNETREFEKFNTWEQKKKEQVQKEGVVKFDDLPAGTVFEHPTHGKLTVKKTKHLDGYDRITVVDGDGNTFNLVMHDQLPGKILEKAVGGNPATLKTTTSTTKTPSTPAKFKKKESDKHAAHLANASDDQRKALLDYTANEYDTINNYLRTGDAMNKNLAQSYVDKIKSTMLPLENSTILYRKLDIVPGLLDERGVIDSLNDLEFGADRGAATNDLIERLSGQQYTERGFLSTATDPVKSSYIHDYDPIWVITAPAGTRGIDVGSVGKFGYNEAEVLIDTGYNVVIDELDFSNKDRGLIIHAHLT